MTARNTGITEVSIAETIGQMEALYAANVGMMVISLPGIGKTEMISQEAKRILEQDLGSKKAAEEAFFIVDMSGIPSESLAVPYINPEASPAQLKLEYLKALANPDTPDDLKEVAKAELDKLMAKDEEVLTHDVAGDAGRLHVGSASSCAELVRPVDDSALHRLESVADIRHGAATDCVEPVLNEVLLELLMEDHLLDGLDDLFLLLASFGH